MTNKIVLTALTVALVAAPIFASAATTLTRQLEVGMTGSDVSSLQTFLAQDTTIYPQGLVTGYFGYLTKSAVSNYQSRNGIDPVGRVGPITLASINAQMDGQNNSDMTSAVISNISVNPSRTTAIIGWNTNENAKGLVYYSTNPLNEQDGINVVTVSGALDAETDTNLRTSQNISLTGLNANTKYYYIAYVTDQAGNVSVTVPSTFQTSN